jgi:hypothetical protein
MDYSFVSICAEWSPNLRRWQSWRPLSTDADRIEPAPFYSSFDWTLLDCAQRPLHLLRIFHIFATGIPATRGWGRQKFRSQVLISYTWLPLRNPRLCPSTNLNSKSRLQVCRAAYLCGIVELVLPSRKHGNNGTRPRTSPTLLQVRRRNRGGLIKLSDSVRFYGACDVQAKVFKGAEENQVEKFVAGEL